MTTRPQSALILFAPGAGASCTSPWMRAWAARLETLGVVEAFDYPYRLDGRRAPDKLPRLIAAHRAALEAARARNPGHETTLLAGKSMGSRVGCHLSLEADVDGLVCLGYPLRGAGKRRALRDEVLLALRAPVLFVAGTRDPLCPLELLESVRARMQARSSLHVVEGGDHSLTLPRSRAAEQEACDLGVLDAMARFLATLRSGV